MRKILTLLSLASLMMLIAVPAFAEEDRYVLVAWEAAEREPNHFDVPQTYVTSETTDVGDLSLLDTQLQSDPNLCNKHFQIDLYHNSQITADLIGPGKELLGPNNPQEDLAYGAEGLNGNPWKFISTDDSACNPPPEQPEPDPDPDPEPEAEIGFVHEAVCSTEDTYDLTLTFSNLGNADGDVNIMVIEADFPLTVPAGGNASQTIDDIPRGFAAEVFIQGKSIFVDDEGIDYSSCTVEPEPEPEPQPEPTPEPDPTPDPTPEPQPEEPIEAPEEPLVPTRVDSGTGGLLPASLPTFVMVLMALGSALMGFAASELVTRKK